MPKALWLLVLVATLVSMPCAAAVKKCTDAKGKVTFQDGVCPSDQQAANVVVPGVGAAKPALVVDKAASAAASAVTVRAAPPPEPVNYTNADGKGAWRGPAEFIAVAASASQPEPRRVAGIVIEFGADGRFGGTIEAAGCKLSGTHKMAEAPLLANVEVAVAGCRDARFNTRYAGTLASVERSKDIKLSLQAQAAAGKPPSVNIDSVLRR